MLCSKLTEEGKKALNNAWDLGCVRLVGAGFLPGWSFNKNPEQVFSEFFGTNSPFAEYGSVPHTTAPRAIDLRTANDIDLHVHVHVPVPVPVPVIRGGGSSGLTLATPAPAEAQLPLEHNLYCTLEELYAGAHKKVKLARRVCVCVCLAFANSCDVMAGES